MKIIEREEVYNIKVSLIRRFFDKFILNKSYNEREVKINFPEFSLLGVSFDDLVYEQPTDDLKGLYILKTESYRPYLLFGSIEHKSGGLFFKKGQENKLYEIFCESIQSSFRNWDSGPAGYLFEELGLEISYSISFMREIFVDSFTKPRKPYFIPKLTLPKDEDLYKEFASDFKSLPWVDETFWNRWEMKCVKEYQGEAYSVVELGERGEAHIDKTFKTHEEAVVFFVKSYLNLLRLLDVERSSFSYISTHDLKIRLEK